MRNAFLGKVRLNQGKVIFLFKSYLKIIQQRAYMPYAPLPLPVLNRVNTTVYVKLNNIREPDVIQTRLPYVVSNLATEAEQHKGARRHSNLLLSLLLFSLSCSAQLYELYIQHWAYTYKIYLAKMLNA